MKTVSVSRAHNALPQVARILRDYGHTSHTRNGRAMQLEEPLSVEYLSPMDCVVEWKERDANPFFHLFEALWMLRGNQDVIWPRLFSSGIGQYSDDGQTFHGAYGHRWRRHFQLGTRSRDQLEHIAQNLRENPSCRRQVLAMWDPNCDLSRDGRDLPCNTHAYLQMRGERDSRRLDLMVCNRSNDVVWGMLGANCVHFGILLGYMAARLGVMVGTYTQVTMNAHIYERHFGLMEAMASYADDNVFDSHIPLTGAEPRPGPMFAPHEHDVFQTDMDYLSGSIYDGTTPPLEKLERIGTHGLFRTPWMHSVVDPMWAAWLQWKAGLPREAIQTLDAAPRGEAWARDGIRWLERRIELREAGK